MNVALNGNQAVSNLTFRNTGGSTFGITGDNTLTLGGGALSYSNAGTLTFNSGGSGGTLAGAGTINIYPGARRDLGDAAKIRLSNNNGTFSGPINVLGGWLDYRADASLGNAGNTITLGSTGAYAKFGPFKTLTSTRNLTLSGIGAWFVGNPAEPLYQNGVLSGSGELIVGYSEIYWTSPSDSSYSGGTRVWQSGYFGRLSFNNSTVQTTKRVLGTGDLRAEYGGIAYVATNSNLDAGAKVSSSGHLLTSPIGFFSPVVVGPGAVPAVATNASGAFGFQSASGVCGAEFLARLTNGAPQLGNGYMRLFSRIDATFSGTTLMPNLDHVFRFYLPFDAFRLTASTGPLQDYGGFTNSLDVAATGNGGLMIYGANTYSGYTRLNGSGTLWGYLQPTAGQSPFGSSNANVVVMGGGLFKLSTVDANSKPIAKNDLTFDGTAKILLDPNDAIQACRLDVNTLTRAGNSTLYIAGRKNVLGASSATSHERFIVKTGAPTSLNGMVSPVYTDNNNYDFLDYGAYGFLRATGAYVTAANDSAFASAADTAIVDVTGAVSAGTKTVYALRANSAISGGPVTITSGGFINRAAVTHTASFVFPSEPIIYCMAGGEVILNGAITSSSGLTKSGGQKLTLGANNSGTLTGTITVNEGTLKITNNNAFAASATIALNGGTLEMPYTASACPWPIALGTNGGTIGAGWYNQFTNKITGSGRLVVDVQNSDIQLTCTNNDYTGGTWVKGNGSGTCKLTLAAGVPSGSGPVRVGSEYTWLAALITQSAANLTTNQRVCVVRDGTWQVQVNGTQTVGSVEGNAVITLNDAGNGFDSTLSAGWDNTDTEFMGSIRNLTSNTGRNGKLTKAGTGTFTLGGYSTYSGATRVENGKLLVNGTIDNDSTVSVVSVSGSAPVLGGKGVVKSAVVTTGGRIAPGASVGALTIGSLTMDSASTLDIEINGPAASQCDLLKVNGTVSLGGASLNLILGYEPAVGTSFTIIDNDGTLDAVSGTFASGGSVTATYGTKSLSFRVTRDGGDNNDVVLTRVAGGTVVFIR
jgi:autotransporter-associated beta strand protein